MIMSTMNETEIFMTLMLEKCIREYATEDMVIYLSFQCFTGLSMIHGGENAV